jgi:eukaryotic-like serine/threonine-protein kinase
MNAPSLADPPAGRKLASAIRAEWSRGAAPDARAALARHPSLLRDESLVLDLAYEEFCRRRQAGERVDREEFCGRFPGVRSRLRNMLDAEHLLGADAGFLQGVFDEARAESWPEPGERFGDFALLRELGRGGFARVFLAREASTGDRAVAVKLSRAPGAEAKTQGPLDHPNVVPVHSARHDPATGLYVVCMPFFGSATLNDVLDHLYPTPGTAPPRAASAIAGAIRRQARPGDPEPAPRGEGLRLDRGAFADGVARLGLRLAEALAFLHARKVYHLDLKPSNVLLTPGGEPLLLDFNLSARPEDPEHRLGGTPPYMAPEHLSAFQGSPAAPLDGRADGFALGVVLYELLTGSHPFGPVPDGDAREQGRVLLGRQKAGCVPVRRRNPDVSVALAGLIERCLRFDPGDRPADAAELAQALRRELSGWRALWRGARRPRVALAGCLAVLTAGVLTAAPLSAPRRGPEAPAGAKAASAAELCERGLRAVDGGAYGDAERLFRDALEADPRHWRAHHGLGLVGLHRGYALQQRARPEEARAWYTEAEESFDEAIKGGEKAGEEDWRAYYARGRAQMLRAALPTKGRAKGGAFREAIKSLTRANDLVRSNKPAGAEPEPRPKVPGHGPALACLAYCYAREGQWSESVAAAQEARDAGFGTPEVLNNLGYCLQKGDFPEKARSYLDRALRLDANLAPAYYNRANFALPPRPGSTPLGLAIDDVKTAISLWETQHHGVPPALYLLAFNLHVQFASVFKPDPDLADLYRLALNLPAQAAHEESAVASGLAEPLREQARDYAKEACAAGVPPSQLQGRALAVEVLGRDFCKGFQLGRPPQNPFPVVYYLPDPLREPLAGAPAARPKP